MPIEIDYPYSPGSHGIPFGDIFLFSNDCEGLWMEEERSTNYWQFREVFEKTGSKAIAVRDTWSGRAFAKYEYSEISDNDVEIRLDEDGDQEIIVHFRKP